MKLRMVRQPWHPLNSRCPRLPGREWESKGTVPSIAVQFPEVDATCSARG